MSWFEGQRRSQRKEFVKCSGFGPHVTKNGSPYLVVGFHKYTALEDGTYLCDKCANRTRRIPRAPDYDKPIIIDLLSEAERTQLRVGLAELRKTFEKMEGRISNKIESNATKI